MAQDPEVRDEPRDADVPGAGLSPEDPGAGLSPEETRVRALLRAHADVGPMPADVVARLDAALAQAAVATTVASLADRRRTRLRRVQRALVAAAGVAVVAAGGTALFSGALSPGGGSASSAAGGGSSAESGLPGSTRVLVGGRDLADGAVLQEEAREAAGTGDGPGANLLGAPADTPQDGSADTPQDGSADTSQDGSADAPQDGGATSAPDRREVAERVVGCAGVDPASVVAVEIATWDGTPAALVVHHRPGAVDEALVVPLDCGPVLSRTDVTAP